MNAVYLQNFITFANYEYTHKVKIIRNLHPGTACHFKTKYFQNSFLGETSMGWLPMY